MLKVQDSKIPHEPLVGIWPLLATHLFKVFSCLLLSRNTVIGPSWQATAPLWSVPPSSQLRSGVIHPVIRHVSSDARCLLTMSDSTPYPLTRLCFEALIALSAGRELTCTQRIETSKDFGSVRIMFGSHTAFGPFRRTLSHVLWWLAKPLSSRSSASYSVVPHLFLPHRCLHPPFRRRCRRNHCRDQSQTLHRLQTQTQSGSPHQHSHRPRQHYHDLQHLHHHWKQGHHLGVRLRGLLPTIECISASMWI